MRCKFDSFRVNSRWCHPLNCFRSSRDASMNLKYLDWVTRNVRFGWHPLKWVRNDQDKACISLSRSSLSDQPDGVRLEESIKLLSNLNFSKRQRLIFWLILNLKCHFSQWLITHDLKIQFGSRANLELVFPRAHKATKRLKISTKQQKE